MTIMIAIGFILGFVGYLPLGNINLSVVQMSVSGEHRKWQLFILFAAAMEFIYCFGCLYGMDQLLKQPQLILILNWTAVIIFSVLGIYTFIHTFRQKDTSSSGLRRGMMVAIFNPLQVPFWMVWGGYVFENGWVKSEASSIALFSLLCAIGTVAVLWTYAVAGRKLVEKLNVNCNAMNRFIGAVFIFLAIYQALKILHP